MSLHAGCRGLVEFTAEFLEVNLKLMRNLWFMQLRRWPCWPCVVHGSFVCFPLALDPWMMWHLWHLDVLRRMVKEHGEGVFLRELLNCDMFQLRVLTWLYHREWN